MKKYKQTFALILLIIVALPVISYAASWGNYDRGLSAGQRHTYSTRHTKVNLISQGIVSNSYCYREDGVNITSSMKGQIRKDNGTAATSDLTVSHGSTVYYSYSSYDPNNLYRLSIYNHRTFAIVTKGSWTPN